MNEQKKNDWIATLFYSPDKTPQDLANLGINTDNSSIQDRDYYKSIAQIQEAFKTEKGDFDEQKFNKFYQDALELYNYADKEKFIQDLTAFYDYDKYDDFAPIGSKVRVNAPSLTIVPNPSRRNRGATNLREASAPTMSIREVAQQNKVFNVETNKFEDWTPNDWGGLSAITRPTLVLAQWDEDGEHEVNGRIISHKKGDLKFNEYGDTYYETLGGRSTANKDILHIADTLSIDGQGWNKYDIFDSDGLDKSVTDTVISTAVKIIPYFIPVVREVYGVFNIAQELGKLLPVLYKSIEGIATNNTSDSESVKTANTIQAWMSRFDSSISDKGRQTFLNLENLGDIIASSSSQLIQQKMISKIPLLMKKLNNGPITENTIKWGRGLSLAYMAGTSSTESYDAFKAAGASDRVAGLGMLAVSGAMFGLMNNDYFRDLWYEGTYLNNAKTRALVKEAAKYISRTNLQNIEKETTKKGAAKWVSEAQKKITNYLSELKPGDLAYGAINEATEEVMEEVSSDIVKASFKGLNALGLLESDKTYDFGITPEDMLSRYFTSFVGGGIGGVVFSLHNKFDKNNNQLNEAIKGDDNALTRMVYILREGKADQFRKEINRLHKAGKLGSKNLSGTEFEIIKDSEDQIQYKQAKDNDSQNDIIRNQLMFYVDRIEEILKEEDLDWSDEELSKLLTEKSPYKGYSVKELRNELKRASRDNAFKTLETEVLEQNFHTKIFEDWNNLTKDIIKTKISIEQMLTPKDNEPKTPKDIEDKIAALKNNAEYNNLVEQLNSLRAQRDSLINGERNDYYLGQLLFASNPSLVEGFFSGFGIHNYTRWKYNKDYNKLSEEEKASIKDEYSKFSAHEEKKLVLNAYDIFSSMNEQLIQSIITAGAQVQDRSKLFTNTIQTSMVNSYLEQTLKAKREELDRLSGDPEHDHSEEIERLSNDIAYLEKAQKANSEFKFGFVNRGLTKEGSNILKRPSDTLDPTLAFDTYARSYTDFLEYIKSHNLYLDLVDSDLLNICQGYIDINNLSNDLTAKWKNRIISYLNNNGLGELQYEADEISFPISVFVDKLVTLTNHIKNGELKEAEKVYKLIRTDSSISDMFDMLREWYNSSVDVQSVLENIIPNIGGSSLIDFIHEVNELKSTISTSPIYDILTKATELSGLNTWDIVNLIKSEQQNLLNSKTIDEYLIQNNWDITKLDETNKLINTIRSVINAASSTGFNSRVNPIREVLNKELLPVIGTENIIPLIDDLSVLQQQIVALIEISKLNQAAKLREQKDIFINMKQKFKDIWFNDNITDKIYKHFGIDIKKIVANVDIPEEINDQNIGELEVALSTIETEFYKEFQNSTLTNNEVTTKLISMFNPTEIISGRPTSFDKSPNTELTHFDQLVYLTTIIAAPTQNFNAKLFEVVNDPEFKFAPIYSQEYATRIGYSYINNTELFNALITGISNLSKQETDDEYLANKSPLYNFLAIYGGAGCGKTAVVDYILNRMFKNEASIIISAPSVKQVENLSNSINHYGIKLTKSQLIQEILGRTLNDSDIIKIESQAQITLDPKVEVNISNKFVDSKLKLLFIDEIGLYDRPELELISKWAVKNNVKVISSGDYQQNPTIRLIDNTIYDTGVLDTIMVKSPDLVAPMRPNNIAKQTNYITLRQRLDDIYKAYYSNPTITYNAIGDIANNNLKQNKIIFKYFEDEYNFGGERIIEANDIRNYINKIKKLSNDYVIITDRPEVYNDLDAEHIIDYKVAQGDEHDYIIIDKDFGVHRGNEYYRLKDIYTLTQRSKRGTLIAKRNLGINYSDLLDPSTYGNIEISNAQIETFRNWRLEQSAKLPKDLIEVKERIILNPNDNNEIEEQDKVQEVPKPDDSNPTKIESEEQPVIVEPIKVPTTRIEVKPTEIKPVIKNNSVQDPVIGDNDIIVTNTEYVNFIKSDENGNSALITFHTENENGLNHVMTFNDSNKLKAINNILRTLFLHGVYKNKSKEKIREQGITLWTQIFPRDRRSNNRKVFLDLIELNPNFYIIPFNNRGLLVARLNYNDTIVDIPLLITEPIIGEYTGSIKFNHKITKDIYDNKEFVEVDTTSFNLDDDYMFYSLKDKLVLIANDSDLEDYTDDQKEFIKTTVPTGSNIGRTFTLVTTNPWYTQDELKAFVTPIQNENGLYSYTTQLNPEIALQGLNYTVSFNEIIEESQKSINSTKRSIINGQTASKILGLSYKVVPTYIENGIRWYFNNQSSINRVIINNEVFDTSDKAIEYLHQNLDSINNIGFCINTQDGVKFNSNGINSIRICFCTVNSGEFLNSHWTNQLNVDQIAAINSLIESSDYFKKGIYGQDIVDYQGQGGGINGSLYHDISNNKTYSWNIKSLKGHSYVLNFEKNVMINPQPLNSPQIDKLNTELKNNGFDDIVITDLSELQSVENTINNRIKSKVNSPAYSIVHLSEDGLSWESITDYTTMILNTIEGITMNDIHIMDTKSLTFKPFFVSLSGKQLGYVIEQVNGDWKIREYSIINEYEELRHILNNNSVLIKNNSTISTYLNKLMNNQDISKKEASDFYLTMSNPIYVDIKNSVDKFLMTKLVNNEC